MRDNNERECQLLRLLTRKNRTGRDGRLLAVLSGGGRRGTITQQLDDITRPRRRPQGCRGCNVAAANWKQGSEDAQGENNKEQVEKRTRKPKRVLLGHIAPAPAWRRFHSKTQVRGALPHLRDNEVNVTAGWVPTRHGAIWYCSAATLEYSFAQEHGVAGPSRPSTVVELLGKD